MAATFAFVVLLLSTFQFLRVAAFNLTISPDHVRISTQNRQSLTITCNADVPLTGCQFSWVDKERKVGPLLEMRRGVHSRADPAHLNGALIGYRYSGRGLAKGDCGVTLDIQGFKVWMVACRAQSLGGSWRYAWMDLFADAWSNPPNTVEPREAVVLPGGAARLTVKSQDPLTECRFLLPGTTSTITFDLGANSPNSTGRHTYLGTGLEAGSCGLTLANVSEVDNGPATCKIRKVLPNADDFRFIALVVASPPSMPVLRVTQEGADVKATCSVQTSRPVADIAWYLGDIVIRKDSLNDSPGGSGDEWRWPWVRGSIMQRVSLRIQPNDNGKFLECVVSHFALARPLQVSEQMLITAMSSAEREAELALVAANSTALAAAEAAELAKEAARVNLEAAKSSANAEEARAKAEEARAKAEEARAREEEAWANNAEEELQFERERRSQSLQQSQSPQDVQG